MIRAFVMLNVETGAEEKVLTRLKAMDMVEEAYVSYGVYDLIIKIKADSMEELKEAVIRKIRSTDQVQSTLTLVLTEATANPA